jgi:putative ABC transport system ATP-binding protein
VGGFRVELQGVTKKFETGARTITALDSVSFSLDPGGILAVTGPSGSGKSTLLHVVGAMDEADAGSITVGDFAVHELDRRAQAGYRRRIGFVFQHFHLLPALTTRDNVAAPLLPHRVDFDKHERARELLAAVGLEGREDDLPSQLSGGEQQRVAIARAVANAPRALLADEPTGNLDPHTADHVFHALTQLVKATRVAMLIATHNMELAGRMDRRVSLVDGQVVELD